MTAWQLRNEYRDLQRKENAIAQAVKRATDQKYVAPLSWNGVKFLEEQLLIVRTRMKEIRDTFKRKEFS